MGRLEISSGWSWAVEDGTEIEALLPSGVRKQGTAEEGASGC